MYEYSLTGCITLCQLEFTHFISIWMKPNHYTVVVYRRLIAGNRRGQWVRNSEYQRPLPPVVVETNRLLDKYFK